MVRQQLMLAMAGGSDLFWIWARHDGLGMPFKQIKIAGRAF